MNNTIDKNDPTPIYYQIVKILRCEIGEKYKRSEPLPSEKELANRFRVSRVTIRKSLETLKKQNLIFTIQGKGTFVSFMKLENIDAFMGFTAKCQAKGDKPESRVLVNEVCTELPQEFKQKLHIDKLPEMEKGFFRLKRLRKINGVPSAIEDSFIPLLLFPGIEHFNFEERSLYQTFAEEYQIIPDWSDTIISAKMANEEDLVLFKSEKYMPIIEAYTITLSEYNQPLEFVKSLYTGNYNLHIKRH